MAFDLEFFIQELILQVITGAVLALVITWWQSHAEERRLIQEQSFLIKHFYEAICEEDYGEVYYFLKLAGEHEKSTIQQILQLEYRFDVQEANRGLNDILRAGNAKIKLQIDFGFQAFIYDDEVKDNEGKGSYYWFLRPQAAQSESNPEVFKKFQLYILSRAKMFKLKI